MEEEASRQGMWTTCKDVEYKEEIFPNFDFTLEITDYQFWPFLQFEGKEYVKLTFKKVLTSHFPILLSQNLSVFHNCDGDNNDGDFDNQSN